MLKSNDATESGRRSPEIPIALAGIGNCASALVQGIQFYETRTAGLIFPVVGRYRARDLKIVAAFDIDSRKVGESLENAVFAKPNCANIFQADLAQTGVTVKMGPIHDGLPEHMAEFSDDESFIVSQAKPVDIARELDNSGAQILVCYLPVGAEVAVKAYAEACLVAGVALVNCVPVFIASDQYWGEKFRSCGLPIIGDDIKSQFGATIVHRALARLLNDRGVTIDRMYQLNTGGNTDFLNMIERSRLQSKKVSKTQSVVSQLDQSIEPQNVHIGPSEYVRWQRDNKVAYIRIEGRGFGDVAVEAEMRLSVQDSPNSAGAVIDAIRFARLGLDRNLAGPLIEPSAYYMKSPPQEMHDTEAYESVKRFVKDSA